jgi:cytoskeleton protein RodZ
MTDLTTTTTTNNMNTSSGIGARFKKTREALGLTTKEAASRLRLNEKFIVMLEEEDFSGVTMPLTFTRGYIRSYGKLLCLDETEIQDALLRIKVPQLTITAMLGAQELTTTATAPSSLRYLKLFAGLIFIAWLSLTGIWWYTHSIPIESAPIILNTTTTEPVPSVSPAVAPALAPALPAVTEPEDPNLPPQLSDDLLSTTTPAPSATPAPEKTPRPSAQAAQPKVAKNNDTSSAHVAKSPSEEAEQHSVEMGDTPN